MIDQNNTFTNARFIHTKGGQLLSDDTFVGFDPNSPNNDGNYTLRTYQYESSNNTWIDISAAELNVPIRVAVTADYSTYSVSDTHLVILDTPSNLSVRIYERQSDRSWKLVDTIPLDSSLDISSVTYNDVDTVVLSNAAAPSGDEESTGVVTVVTRIKDNWAIQNFTTTSVGYRPVGLFGGNVVFLDASTMLVGAGLAGIPPIISNSGPDQTTTGGKVLLLVRNPDTGLWEPDTDLVGPRMWGLGIGVNDYDIVIPSLIPYAPTTYEVNFYTLPRCFTQPINVTCNDQQVNDCSQLNVSSLYTINNAQCGAVTTSLHSMSLRAKEAIEAQFSFSRGFGASVSCDATVTCPAPPVVVQHQTPSKVSGAHARELGIVTLLACVLVTTIL